jgi:hypothetical protein
MDDSFYLPTYISGHGVCYLPSNLRKILIIVVKIIAQHMGPLGALRTKTKMVLRPIISKIQNKLNFQEHLNIAKSCSNHRPIYYA